MLKQIISMSWKMAALTLTLASTAFAGSNFTIAPTAGVALPTTVPSGSMAFACYTITNNTNVTLPKSSSQPYHIVGLPANQVVTQDISGANCPHTFPTCPVNISLAGKASCNLQLNISSGVETSFALCSGNSCTTAAVPLHVQSGETKSAYITDASSQPILYRCPVNADDSLGACSPTSTGTMFTTNIAGLALNPLKSGLYVTDNTTIYYCPIAGDGSVACQPTTTSMDEPIAIALDASGAYAYVLLNVTNSVQYCPVQSDGSLGVCMTTAAGTTPAFAGPTGIALNPTKSVAYIVDPITDPATVYYCLVQPDGSLGACAATALGTNPAFTAPWGIAVNPAGTFAYIVDIDQDAVYSCPVNNNDGSLGACSVTAIGTTPALTDPVGIALNASGSFAYIVDGVGPTAVYACPVNPDGSLGACGATANGTSPAFASPYGVTI